MFFWNHHGRVYKCFITSKVSHILCSLFVFQIAETSTFLTYHHKLTFLFKDFLTVNFLPFRHEFLSCSVIFCWVAKLHDDGERRNGQGSANPKKKLETFAGSMFPKQMWKELNKTCCCCCCWCFPLKVALNNCCMVSTLHFPFGGPA